MQNILDEKQAGKSRISFFSAEFIKLMLYHFFRSIDFYVLLSLTIYILFNWTGKGLSEFSAINFILVLLLILKFGMVFIVLALISAIFPTFAGAYVTLLFSGLKLQLQKEEIQWLGFGSKLRKKYKIRGKIHRVSIRKEGRFHYIYIGDDGKNDQLIATLSLDFVCREIIELIQDYYQIEKEDHQKKEIHIPMKKPGDRDIVKPDMEEEEISGYAADFDDFDTD